jgi:hypothetical protein
MQDTERTTTIVQTTQAKTVLSKPNSLRASWEEGLYGAADLPPHKTDAESGKEKSTRPD